MHHTVHTYPARGTLGIHVKEPAKRLRVSRRATGNPTHTGYGTCPYRLHQLRPTNQTHIRLARCTNRAGPLSTLLFFPFSLPLSLPLVLPLSRPPLLSPFSRISSSGSVCIVTLLFDRPPSSSTLEETLDTMLLFCSLQASRYSLVHRIAGS